MEVMTPWSHIYHSIDWKQLQWDGNTQSWQRISFKNLKVIIIVIKSCSCVRVLPRVLANQSYSERCEPCSLTSCSDIINHSELRSALNIYSKLRERRGISWGCSGYNWCLLLIEWSQFSLLERRPRDGDRTDIAQTEIHEVAWAGLAKGGTIGDLCTATAPSCFSSSTFLQQNGFNSTGGPQSVPQ